MIGPEGRTLHWPAEWEPHSRTWIAWPHEREDWPGKFEPIPWVYAEIVRHLCRSERVAILVQNEDARAAAKDVLSLVLADLTRVEFHVVPTDRVWTRDSGPIFVRRGSDQQVALDWRFNGWAKYDNFHDDDAVVGRLAREMGWETLQPTCHGQRVVLEGGSIDGNGEGLLLTTEECLLSDVQQRNPGLGKEDYERLFGEYLGIKKVLWLNQGIVGDDTHGHIDDLARFVDPRTIVVATETDRSDPNFDILQENFERLRHMTDVHGGQFRIVQLPMPDPVVFEGRRLPASYANFYVATDCVLVPTFNSAHDRVALGRLADLFPDRKVFGIHAVDLVWGLGTIHCMTQQEPA